MHGVIETGKKGRRTDYLYRISLKALIRNEKDEVLVVKETNRDWWDLPGGGLDHGEEFEQGLARELKEEVNLAGNFTWHIIDTDEPKYLDEHGFYQIRLIFELIPQEMEFSAGDDGDEVAFMDPDIFKNSQKATERRIWEYSQHRVDIG